MSFRLVSASSVGRFSERECRDGTDDAALDVEATFAAVRDAENVRLRPMENIVGLS